MANVVYIADYFERRAAVRQNAQIESSLLRLSKIPSNAISIEVMAMMIEFLDGKGIDTTAKSVTQNIPVIQYLVQGLLEDSVAQETNNTLMLGAARITYDMMSLENDDGSCEGEMFGDAEGC